MEMRYKKLRKSLKRMREALEQIEVIESLLDDELDREVAAAPLERALDDFALSLHAFLKEVPRRLLPSHLQHRDEPAPDDANKLSAATAVVVSNGAESNFSHELRLVEARLQNFMRELLKKELPRLAKMPARKKEESDIDEAVRQSEQRLRTIIDSTPLGIVITNEDTIIEYANQAYCEIYGYLPEELIGKSFTIVVPPEKKDFWIDLHQKYLDGYKEIRGEWEVRHKSGRPIYILADAARIIGTDGKRKKVTFVSDITEMVKLKEDARQTEIQLMQAEKMSSLGQMVAGVAHEINTPLGFIKGNLQLLLEAQSEIQSLLDVYTRLKDEILFGTSEKVAELIDLVEERSRAVSLHRESVRLCQNSLEGIARIQELVSSLKNFSRLDEAAMKTARLSELIDSSLKIAEHLFREKNIEVVRNYQSDPSVLCYPAQLNQVFLNLFTNAVHAIEHDKGKVVITVSETPDWAVVKVADNGIGIKPEHLKKIFEPFFTTKEVGKGTGLGLSISYKIIEKHNGTIEVESTVGEGATFTVKLPLKSSPKASKPETAELVSPFVEDEPEVKKKQSQRHP
ncbi:MAG: ATP-binding protein [Chloroherpetonaceae bacterium]|nr:ATP-binding protein [Chloroherpetonaceae bacterium]